ncbi:MAG: sigma-70 family RNA polymerase sigma factor [Lachnospiraceae bacterium]|nr:sigma-70 family RNA polymerase sigma factor [Lachnospiraceae bacterium]
MTNEELVRLIKAGVDRENNMLQLYIQVKGFIRTIAMRYRGRAEMEDLEQEGFLALYDAVEGYDSGRGCMFLTYAGYWIKRRLSQYAGRSGNAASLPAEAVKRLAVYKNMVNTFLLCTGRELTKQEAAECMKIPISQVEELERLACMEKAESLEVPAAGSRHDTALCDLLPSAENLEAGILEQVQRGQLARILWAQVDRLPAEQGRVIRAKYLDGRTYREISAGMGIEAGKVRNIEHNALWKLRLSRDSCLLRSFLPEYEEIYSRGIKGSGSRHFDTTWTSSTERVALEDMARKSVTSSVTSRI